MNKEELEKLIKSNSNYWERRSLEGKLNALENEEDYLRRLESFYSSANKQIDDKLAKVYARYAKENKITVEEAYKQLPKAMEKEYKNDVMDYITKAKSGDPQYQSYLLNQSIMHKHSVLDQMRTEVRNAVYSIDMDNTQGKFLSKIFQNANYQMQYSGNEPFAKIDPAEIQQVLEQNWSGEGSFSDIIWKNKDKLVKALDEIMMQGITTGESYDKMASKLAKKMDNTKSNAKRLIVTEAARMHTQGKLAYYAESGVKELINIATLDMKTSDICRHMDGTIVPIEEAKLGLNIPPFHPYCRTVVSPHYEDNEPETRVYRDKETKKTKSGRYRTYKEYLEEELGDKKKAEALASTRNDLLTLIAATSVVPVKPPITEEVVYKNPNYVIELPDEDRHTLLQMKGSTINEINNKLSNELDIDEKTQEMINNIDKALDKLPFYNGEVTTDIRLGNNNPLDGLGIGDTWKVKKYLFSTKNSKYYNDTNYRFIIKSKTGRDIGKKILNYKKLKEVIFARETEFIIRDIKVKKDIVYYYLEQLV